MDDTLERLKVFLLKKYGIPVQNMTRETSLVDDLEIKGDDFDLFFLELIEDFSIEVKRLNLSRFIIGHEPFDFINPIIDFFMMRSKRTEVLRIKDIEKFIETGILE